jgi:hypothetical protein
MLSLTSLNVCNVCCSCSGVNVLSDSSEDSRDVTASDKVESIALDVEWRADDTLLVDSLSLCDKDELGEPASRITK